MQQNEEVRQETEELSAVNTLLREQAYRLTEGKEKLLSDNQKLEKEQERLQQEIEKMANSKVVIEPECREGVRERLERMKALCKERNDLYEKQNDLKGKKQQIERALEW